MSSNSAASDPTQDIQNKLEEITLKSEPKLEEKEGENSKSESKGNTSAHKSSNGQKTMYLMRGAPGSGKSTQAKELMKKEGNEQGVVFSTDDYFMQNPKGEYLFNASDLGKAHQWNQDRTEKSMVAGVSPIIIDNTNTMRWEAKQYVVNAQAHGYSIVIVEPDTEWWKSKDAVKMSQLNKHGVPLDAIKRMLSRWEDNFTVESILKSSPPGRNTGGGDRNHGSPRSHK
eukprot:TRINITY_DN14994_c0_g1_i1.p1 TRINITY_DN14994_c0_g1~~TRINITY_DN14994_c0_g1_i1.p1  ORF type:complete len:228 (-),score=66.79 TRINITY_DN14994_c0_g1_i1:55-738(-)